MELPYSLYTDTNSYLEMREKENISNDDLLFLTNKNNKIKSSFLNEDFNNIKDEYKYLCKDVSNKNQLTITGLQQYAIIQMIFSGMNQSVIMSFTGQKDIIYNNCQDEVNRIKELDRNRYINHMIRGINTYDRV